MKIDAAARQETSLASLRAFQFILQNWIRIIACSVAALVPCFWHGHIEASDLGSHTYNVWLAQLIESGQVSGLHIARVWSNVLFDLLLSGFAKLFPLLVAEKIAVSIAVLIFFWGAFAMVSAASERARWFLTPAIAMATYGWVFELGFCNYYLSLGISFFGIAIFWRGKGWERLILAILAPLVLLAHAAGLVWMLCAALYIKLSESRSRVCQAVLFLASAAMIFGVRAYLFDRYVADPAPAPLYFFSGFDQLILFGRRYWLPAIALLIIFITMILHEIAGKPREDRVFWSKVSLPLQLYILVELAVILLPDGIHFPQFSAALALVTPRLTVIASILLCCIAGAVKPRRWQLWALAPAAALFFVFLHQDTGKVSAMENNVAKLVRTAPRNARILATIWRPAGSRVLVQHIVDRACICWCFSFGNYEPASRAFRIRVDRPNPYAMQSSTSTSEMESGTYTVQEEDLPAYQVYQCGKAWTDLCIRPLAAGEDNDRMGVHAPGTSPQL